MRSLALEYGTEIKTTTSYVVRILAPRAAIHQEASENSAVEFYGKRGQVYEAEGRARNGWIQLTSGGYLRLAGNASLVEQSHEKVDLSVKKRRETVEYALQFVGGRYVYGGTDPNVGVDCSGFTRYVMSNAASVQLPHSSRGQASYGREVSEEEMKPGDLIFYGSGKRINHVAMYIGEGQVVHASTEKTGIKTSPWNYREPVKIVSLL
ncbi:MAG TPA: C40 family peptidase [Candidatus Enterocloster faecavium]|uniref:C40 family peptidase n=1 Tax=Candidatus Enterocloster faecavium TaxID=2838560 RepID=A0A9D2L7L1_9FIRM|nr:C40 family peptidase [Candidatus Enterocloster faecavium]